MDFHIIRESAPVYTEAAVLTLRIGLISVALSLVLGLVVAGLVYFKVPILRQLAAIYVELSRNTPLLIQLFFLYFGLPKIGITLDAELCAIVGLTFLGGSYMAEAFRSGFREIELIQYESSLSLGMRPLQAFQHVLLPQATATAIPALTANTIFLIKETSVVSAIALADLFYRAKEQMGIGYTTNEALFLLTIAYLIILLPISVGCRLLERRFRSYAVVSS